MEVASRPVPYDAAVEAALAKWRRQMTDVLLAAISIAFMPGVSLWLTGNGPLVAWPVSALMIAAYLTALGCAVLRRVSAGARLGVLMGTGYLLSIVASVAMPQGPFVRSLPISSAIVAVVLLGVRAGRISMVIGVVVLLFSPFLRNVPGVMEALTVDSRTQAIPAGILLTQGFALAASLIGLMIVLGSYHQFLLQTLAAEHQGSVRLEHEVAERAAAHRKLELAMLERRRLERELGRIGDEERRRLGQDVHDGVCQQLTGALLRCQALERGLEHGRAAAAADVRALSDLLEAAIDEAYSVARGLDPLEAEPGALVRALRSLARRTQGSVARCEFTASGDTNIDDPALARQVYRIAQEAVSNAVRHAQAGRIAVELRGCDDTLMLRVEDDGRGMPSEPRTGGMGLRTMAYRTQALEGTLTVEPAPGGGTRVTCCLPRVARADQRPQAPERRGRSAGNGDVRSARRGR